MELAEAAGVLCRTAATQSVYVRAIKLFEFQVSIFAPNSHALQLDARVLVAIRILEHIQKSSPSVNDDAALTELLALPEYAEIASIVFQSGGWRRIRQLWSAKEFDQHFASRREEAKIVAQLADFSFRFAKLMPDDSRKGGPTMARKCLHDVNKENVGYSTGTLKSRWSQYGSAAALQYVLLIQNIGPKLLKLNKVGFVEKLVAQTSDVNSLRSFFSAYRDVSKVLRPRGYDSPLLALDDLRNIDPKLSIEKFSKKMREAIQGYKS
jgi:hypothetical protein